MVMPPKGALLVVDDTEANLDLLVDMLGDDYDVMVAPDGEAALEAALECRPELILLDILMPGLDGYEVCRRLKAHEDLKNIPVIFTTALGEENDEAKGLALGAVDYIIKPLKPAIVRARVRAHLDLKRKTDQLETLICLDGLTGVANRRGLDLALNREWGLAARNGSVLSFILMDIDHFKAYNDRHGHAQGDACLRQVAQALNAALNRPGDYLARYGGEEFAAVLPGTTAEGAVWLAQRLRQAVLDLGLAHGASPAGDLVSLSLGVGSMRPRPQDEPSKLIELADKALYAAKAAGRNQVILGEQCP